MDFDAFTTLWERHPAWRLLRAHHSPLILTFLGTFFVEGNRGASSAGELATALDDLLYDLNTSLPTNDGSVRFPKEPAPTSRIGPAPRLGSYDASTPPATTRSITR